MANFKINTRYTNGIITKNANGEDFLVLRRPLNLEESSGDTFVTITKDLTKRPDLIAFKAYGNVDLWWVIYEYNGLHDPFVDLKEGSVIRIPEKTRVLDAIKQMGTK